MSTLVKVAVGALGPLLVGGMAMAAPKAGAATKSWQLDVRFHDPQRITVQLPGDSYGTTFWYMLYQVTNTTGRDVPFYPSFRLVADTLKMVEGGAAIPPRVYDAIAARHKREFPFLAPPTQVTGRLLQGEANARASVSVFRTFDPEATSFSIYASGFSGDIERVANPSFDPSREESDSNARFFVLRRTLAITYDLPGAAEARGQAKPVRRTREWVLR
jgi:hypothetical protein